mgnify:CR=1 FL=1
MSCERSLNSPFSFLNSTIFFATVELIPETLERSGADAVYLGLENFNARRNAENFTINSLKEAVAFCHVRGVKVYLTLNIMLKDDEIENAVKHGVGRKIGGGTVTIHTSETENEYIICVTDDGVGFTEGEYVDDGSTHVGIENIKKRLDMMINARLEMESKKGIGTKACIFIPKRRDETCIS